MVEKAHRNPCRSRALFTLLFICSPLAAKEDHEISRIELAAHAALQRIVIEADEPLAPFETDGCSGGLSGSWRIVAESFPEFSAMHGETPPWEACCVTHDHAYHAGGYESSPEAGHASRLAADDALRRCVRDLGEERKEAVANHYDTTPEEAERAYRTIGEAMFLAVRFGGGPCSGLPWRWGYGSRQCRATPADFRATAGHEDP